MPGCSAGRDVRAWGGRYERGVGAHVGGCSAGSGDGQRGCVGATEWRREAYGGMCDCGAVRSSGGGVGGRGWTRRVEGWWWCHSVESMMMG